MSAQVHKSVLHAPAMTYEDFLIGAAREYGFGETGPDGLAVAPSDPEERRRCAQAVARGLAIWADANPSGWRLLRRRFSITSDGSSSYRMPWDFCGSPIGDWIITSPSRSRVRTVDPLVLADAPEGGSIPFDMKAAYRKNEQVGPTGSSLSRWSVEFRPPPPPGCVLEVEYEGWVGAMGLPDDVFFAGEPYDRSALDCVIHQAALDCRKDERRITETLDRMQRSLAAAVERDRRSGGAFFGTMRRTTPVEDEAFVRPVGRLRFFNGAPLTV